MARGSNDSGVIENAILVTSSQDIYGTFTAKANISFYGDNTSNNNNNVVSCKALNVSELNLRGRQSADG